MLKAGPTDANVLALVRAGAMPLGVVDIFPGIDFSSLDMASLRNRLAALGRSGFLDPSQFPTAAAAKQLLDLMREDGVAPTDYGPLLQRYWLLVACEKAGIYLDGWDPTQGADANMPNLVASYRYYGNLYLSNPDFQWAGMAGMIGPTFAGGMFDLQMLSKLGDLASTPLDVAPDWLVGPLLPPQLRDLAILGQMSEHEFQYFETSLLQMQKDIFSDQMPMHEAYMANGHGGHQGDVRRRTHRHQHLQRLDRHPQRRPEPGGRRERDPALPRAARHHRPGVRRHAQLPRPGRPGDDLHDGCDRGAGHPGCADPRSVRPARPSEAGSRRRASTHRAWTGPGRSTSRASTRRVRTASWT